MSDAETKTIVGQCEEISEKNGWTAFAINVGSQYPVKLSTKVAAIIDSARAVGGDVATWTYKETEGNENPNRPGTHYMNRYLEKVEAGAQSVATTPGAPQQPTSQQTALPVETTASEPVDWDAKERRDFRSRAWAQTLGAFTHTIKADEDPKEVFRRLQPFQLLVYSDVVRDLANTDDSNDIPFLWHDNYSVEPTQTEWSDPWRRG